MGSLLPLHVLIADDDPVSRFVVRAAVEKSAREAMEAGADDLLVKPLDAAALERQLISARRVIDMHDCLRIATVGLLSSTA
jgi:CheY-like chemotaxis protein